MEKTFKIAGVSRLKGIIKARFANDMSRVKTLIKTGHSEIDLIELKEPMTKADAVAFLLSIDFATKDGKTDAEVKAALEGEVEKRSDKPATVKTAKVAKAEKPTLDKIAARGPKKPALEKSVPKKAAPKSTVSRKEIEAQMAELDDAPF